MHWLIVVVTIIVALFIAQSVGWSTISSENKQISKAIIAIFLLASSALFVFVISTYDGATMFHAIQNEAVFLWLIPIAVIDYRKRIIPNPLIIVGVFIWFLHIIAKISLTHTDILSALVFSIKGVTLAGSIFIISLLLLKNSIGMGDIKLFSVIGLIYGFSDTFVIIFLSLVATAIIALYLLMVKKLTRKTLLPMGPFILIGFFVYVCL